MITKNMHDKHPREKIIGCINSMIGSYSAYQIFNDWVEMMALAFANQVMFVGHNDREKAYLDIVKRYDTEERNKMCEMAAWLTEWADTEMTDMLGYIFMHLNMGSNALGQFFTPYHLCQLVAKLMDVKDGNVINEPTCGAGGNIIAYAEMLKDNGINYQQHMYAVCQDIDLRAVFMCYVQLSIYGVPACVYQANTLSDPNGLNSSTGKWYTFMAAMNLTNVCL